MITEFFIDLAVNFIAWLAGVMGSWTPPEQLVEAATGIQGALGNMSGVGVWVEWAVLGACTVAATTTWLIVFGLRLILRVASHVPLVGGAG